MDTGLGSSTMSGVRTIAGAAGAGGGGGGAGGGGGGGGWGGAGGAGRVGSGGVVGGGLATVPGRVAPGATLDGVAGLGGIGAGATTECGADAGSRSRRPGQMRSASLSVRPSSKLAVPRFRSKTSGQRSS